MRNFLVVMFLTVLVMVGCSQGGTPITPVSDERPTTPVGSLDSLPIIDGTAYSDGSFNALGVLGAYELRIDPATMTADLVAKRTPALGQSWTVSGLAFFTIAPCSNCLTLDSIALTVENYLQMRFAIKHPFKPGVSTLPPSASNRLDLDVFDLAAIVVPIGATPTNYALMGAKAYTGVLANNAGFTTELKSLLNDTAAMPYALVVDDSETGTSTWNKFAMGANKLFDIYFNLNTLTTLQFDMYLTMGYGASAQGKNQRLSPTYFNPEFNKKAAWKVKVTPPQGSNPPAMGNTWQHNDATTMYNVKVEVYDWQQGVTSIANPPVNPGDIAYASNVASVSVEIPGMTNTLPTVNSPSSGTGSPSDPLVFLVPVANQNLLGVGQYLGLVKVLDSRVPPATPPGPDGIDFMIHTPDGINLANYAIPEYATYQTFTATVVLGCGPITGSITDPACPVTNVANGAKINFKVNASSANGGNPIVLYECDYNYDGTTFTPDFSNTTGTFNNVGPFTVPDPCPSNVPKDFIVAFRATDSCVPPNVTIFATCTVTVTSCLIYQELNYTFSACTSYTTSCATTGQGTWQAGGCSLPNTDGIGWGHFCWGCNAGLTCGDMAVPYITSGGDVGGCSWLNDMYAYPTLDLNVVSPTINLPSSPDSIFQFDICRSMGTWTNAYFRVYISTNGCSGPWNQIYQITTDGCSDNVQIPINSYSGSNVRVRLQLYSNNQYNYYSATSPCGSNTGVVIDNIKIFGNFSGTLSGS